MQHQASHTLLPADPALSAYSTRWLTIPP